MQAPTRERTIHLSRRSRDSSIKFQPNHGEKSSRDSPSGQVLDIMENGFVLQELPEHQYQFDAGEGIFHGADPGFSISFWDSDPDDHLHHTHQRESQTPPSDESESVDHSLVIGL